MSIVKRLRMFYAICTQDWRLVTCSCGQESWVIGKAQIDSVCEDCALVEHEQWVKDFLARHQQQHGIRKGVA